MASLNITRKRLIGELKNLEKNREPYYQVVQDQEDILKFYFMIKGDQTTDYNGGYYIGRIILPPNYPANPGNFYMLTPSGRFAVDSKICLTNSGYHRENWTPMWNIQNMVIGFISIFTSDETSGISHIRESPRERRKKAFESVQYNLQYHRDIFRKFDQFVNSNDLIRSNEEVLELIEMNKPKKKIKEPKIAKVSKTSILNNIPTEPHTYVSDTSAVPLPEVLIPEVPLPEVLIPAVLIPEVLIPEVLIPEVPVPDISHTINKPDLNEADIFHVNDGLNIGLVVDNLSKISKPVNHNQWIDYIRNSSLETFDENIFMMEFNAS